MTNNRHETTIELYKEDMKFAAGHYTIFSPTERETLHGHNFNVYAAITAEFDTLGMPFDYDVYKTKLRKICRYLNHYTLIAGNSPYQSLSEKGDYLEVRFAEETLIFLKKDIKILPLSNITVEELSRWFLDTLLNEMNATEKNNIKQLVIKVYSAPGQCASAQYPTALNNANLG